MVLEATTDAVVEFVLVVGVPVLFVLFYFEGLVIGKLLQPPAVFVATVAIANPGVATLAALVVGCTIAVTVGQWTLYRGFDDDSTELFGLRRTVPYLEQLPATIQDRVGERRIAFVDRIFRRYGGSGIFVTTFIPGIRGLVAIPAAISSYPTGRFLAVSAAGNVVYFLVLVAIARGILELLGIL